MFYRKKPYNCPRKTTTFLDPPVDAHRRSDPASEAHPSFTQYELCIGEEDIGQGEITAGFISAVAEPLPDLRGGQGIL